MTPAPIARGGVIAAGEGSRLRGAGPKALVHVGGQPLLGHALERFQAAGIRRVVVIVREADRALADWARSNCPDLDLDVIVKTTPSSAASFLEVAARMEGERAVITTVDAVLAPRAFVDFVRTAEHRPPEALGLGVTDWVDDERPLWAEWDEDGRVLRLGGSSGRGVTAGLYVVPADFPRQVEALPADAPLRRLLAAWVEIGRPAWAQPLGKVVDVDRPADVAVAEALWRAAGGEKGRA